MDAFELDERMTEETRIMVSNSLKVMRPGQLGKIFSLFRLLFNCSFS
jgi:hypothetical protein